LVFSPQLTFTFCGPVKKFGGEAENLYKPKDCLSKTNTTFLDFG
jgi:hypothetical protein